MVERYKHLFRFGSPYFLDGAPVLIANGALLLDSVTSRVLVQLKFRSLSQQQIKAVKICIRAFGPNGNEIQGVNDFMYIDLDVARGGEFGQKMPVFLPSPLTRSFSAAVTEVHFSDGGIWQQEQTEWKPLPQPKSISAVISSEALRKQYALEVERDAPTLPEAFDGLWYCVCGALNTAGEPACYQCGNRLEVVSAALYEPALQEKLTARMAAEAKAEAARNAELIEKERQTTLSAAKKKKKTIITAISAAIAVLSIVIMFNTIIIPSSKYQKAEALRDAGDYDGAVATFTELGGFKDAAEQVYATTYAKAEALLQEGRYA